MAGSYRGKLANRALDCGPDAVCSLLEGYEIWGVATQHRAGQRGLQGPYPRIASDGGVAADRCRTPLPSFRLAFSAFLLFFPPPSLSVFLSLPFFLAAPLPFFLPSFLPSFLPLFINSFLSCIVLCSYSYNHTPILVLLYSYSYSHAQISHFLYFPFLNGHPVLN